MCLLPCTNGVRARFPEVSRALSSGTGWTPAPEQLSTVATEERIDGEEEVAQVSQNAEATLSFPGSRVEQTGQGHRLIACTAKAKPVFSCSCVVGVHFN